MADGQMDGFDRVFDRRQDAVDVSFFRDDWMRILEDDRFGFAAFGVDRLLGRSDILKLRVDGGFGTVFAHRERHVHVILHDGDVLQDAVLDSLFRKVFGVQNRRRLDFAVKIERGRYEILFRVLSVRAFVQIPALLDDKNTTVLPAVHVGGAQPENVRFVDFFQVRLQQT